MVQVGWKNAFYGETGSLKGLEKLSTTTLLCTLPIGAEEYSKWISLQLSRGGGGWVGGGA